MDKMAICSECGYKIEKEGWAIGKLEKRLFLMTRVCDHWVCSRTCAEKLMKRLENRCRNVPYSSKGG